MIRLSKSLAIAATAVAVALAAKADPVAEGLALYAKYCLTCHGPTATEGRAGDIRGLSLITVTGAVRGGPGEMPVLGLEREEIEAIHAHLVRLRDG